MFPRRVFISNRRLSTTRSLTALEKLIGLVLLICSVSMLYFAWHASIGSSGMNNDHTFKPVPAKLKVDYFCQTNNSVVIYVNEGKLSSARPPVSFFMRNVSGLPTDNRILVLVETSYSNFGKQIGFILDSLKFSYRVEVLRKNLPLLTTVMRGKYLVIIFENYYKYLNLNSWNKQLLDKYCKDYSVGIIGFLFTRKDKDYERARVLGFPLEIYQKQIVADIWLDPNSTIFHITRPSRAKLTNFVRYDDWLTFSPKHTTYEPVLWGSIHTSSNTTKDRPVVVLDSGKFDGITRVLFGFDFRLWLIKLLFVDAVHYLGNGRLRVPLTRYLQIDIDDIFVGPRGYRMIEADVKALLAAQKRLRHMVPGFKFHLGFSGKYYRNGYRLENEADEYLLQTAAHFAWFPHMWKHNHVQAINESHLMDLMTLNKLFAQKYHLPVRWGYAVAPHHAGVYPVHEALYSAWKKVWNIQVTSTEEYPHQKPSSLRRGFIYRDVMVLPRQTCGLYTHTMFLEKYPGGREKLEENIFGGNLFFAIIFNPYLIFMTHSTNYANDRLALYTFESEIRFVQCWTRLSLEAVSPLEMASRYFSDYPDEKLPVWGNPCLDKKHLDIWSPGKRCEQLPRALIIGPQKTGTTALYSFLKMHPSVRSNAESQKTFEEVQFFSGRNYKNGLDWYMSFFESPAEKVNSSIPYFFEKSATYFDAELAPKRVKALIPDARLIAILTSPAQRAYSWYQHMRAHEDPAAIAHSFREVLETDSKEGDLWKLRQHCLVPGMYSHHIEAWLGYFSYKQILLLDGEELKVNPAKTMGSVQAFLGLDPVLNYSTLIRYIPDKGFYCMIELSNTGNVKEKTKCLGKSKGRVYPPMDQEDRIWLLRYFRPYNVALHSLMTKYAFPVPDWLQQELEETV